MKIDDRIYELISGKLENMLSSEEELELSNWLSEDVEHEKVFAEVKKIRDQAKLLHRNFTPDTENVLKRLKGNRGKKVVFRGWWKYVAILIVPLGIALGLWQGLKREQVVEHRQFSAISTPGTERAILKLLDGETVLLDSTMKSSLIAQGTDVRIEMDSNRLLRYSPNDSIAVSDVDKNNELIIPKGGEYQIILADGTRVWLNSASKLTFPPYFTGAERRVTLSGEAFFDVAHDDKKPFIVETARMDVKVLGTRFNVNAYEDNEVVSATLVNGSVEVFSGEQQTIRLAPGEQAYGKESELEKREVNVRLYTSWIDGKFMFNNTELEEIAKQISRWYDVEVVFTHPSLRDAHFTLEIKRYDNISDVLVRIEKTERVKFRVEGNVVTVDE